VVGVWLVRLRVWSLRFRAWCLVFGGEGLVVRVMAEFDLGLSYVPVGNRSAMLVWRFGLGFRIAGVVFSVLGFGVEDVARGWGLVSRFCCEGFGG
jgi:hypothetical protein